MDINNYILAIITTKANGGKINSGSTPVFYAENKEELEYIAMLLC